jgi:hypothetical protein
LPFAAFVQSTQTFACTVKDGLPSNALYRTLIDKKRFLWIAPEIGPGRFDRKKFIWTIQTPDNLGQPINPTEANGESISELHVFYVVKNAACKKEKNP